MTQANYVILFQDGETSPVSEDQLYAWCSDLNSWLGFVRLLLHPGYVAEMTVHLPGRDPETIRVIPQDKATVGSNYQDPFAQRVKA